MARAILVIALALVLAVLICACGSEPPKQSQEQAPPQAQPQTPPSPPPPRAPKPKPKKASHPQKHGKIPEGAQSDSIDRVVDGDTVVLTKRGKSRLIGIDTPEVYRHVQCYGEEASAFTERTIPSGTKVWIKVGTEPRDRYHRQLVYLWLGDGRFFNAMLASEGYATPLTIPPNDDYAPLFRKLARKAREHDKGLWSPSTCGGRSHEHAAHSSSGGGSHSSGGGGRGRTVQCKDGTYSHSGGRRGACSHHGGEKH